MTISQQMTKGRLPVEVVGTLGVVALAFAVLTRRRSRSHQEPNEPRASLVTYLREHVAGADAAIQVVERLKHTHRGTAEGTLFASLYQQFLEHRAVVTALLADLGASPRSIKQLAGHATGAARKAAAGGKRGELTLFRTLEALAIGVQGKRCVWRAAQVIGPSLRAPDHRNFAELESHAIKQWEAIERCRRSLALPTFSI